MPVGVPPAPATAPTEARRMQWFADAKFGLFIHWGIHAVDGIDELWSFYDGYVSHPRRQLSQSQQTRGQEI